MIFITDEKGKKTPQERWDGKNLHTVSCKLKTVEWLRLKDCAEEEGTTVYAIVKEAVLGRCRSSRSPIVPHGSRADASEGQALTLDLV